MFEEDSPASEAEINTEPPFWMNWVRRSNSWAVNFERGLGIMYKGEGYFFCVKIYLIK